MSRLQCTALVQSHDHAVEDAVGVAVGGDAAVGDEAAPAAGAGAGAVAAGEAGDAASVDAGAGAGAGDGLVTAKAASHSSESKRRISDLMSTARAR